MTCPDSLCFGLLAGGKSRRMGRDKAELNWHGQPLWQHQLRLAAEINANEILISGNSEGPYRYGALVVPDETPDAGPVAGVATLLGAMKSEWLVAVAVDMPFLNATAVSLLLDARSDGRGAVPRINGRAEPLAAVYPRRLVTTARAHVASADRSLQAFVRAAQAAGFVELIDWPGAQAAALRSLNTPQEWDMALKT